MTTFEFEFDIDIIDDEYDDFDLRVMNVGDTKQIKDTNKVCQLILLLHRDDEGVLNRETFGLYKNTTFETTLIEEIFKFSSAMKKADCWIEIVSKHNEYSVIKLRITRGKLPLARYFSPQAQVQQV